MVEFRKRFPPKAIFAILAALAPRNNDSKQDGGAGGGSGSAEPKNSGMILTDATCCPADVAFPQEV